MQKDRNVTPMIRAEESAERDATESLVRDAFWDVYRPGCEEHLLFHNLRQAAEFVPDLCLVAVDGEALVGCVVGTRAQVVDDARGHASEVLCIGPLAVHPDRQREGIGGALMGAALARAREQGFVAAFLYGSPAYYPRFGFEDARCWNITTADGSNFAAFMGTELVPSGLDGISGRYIESSAFELEPAAVAEFDRKFPPREKHFLPSRGNE